MTVKFSTGLRNAMVGPLGFAGALSNGVIEIRSGPQPVSADAASTGTLLGVVTIGSGAMTNEVQASGSITLSGAAGSVNTVTVSTLNIIPDGPVPFNTSIAQTATDLAEAINRNGIYTAAASGAVVTIKPRPGAGAAHNGSVVSATLTTLTATYSNMTGGVSAVNALAFASPVAGTASKPPGKIWSFNGIASGVAGYFRFVGSVGDAGAAVSAAPFFVRLDGSVANVGADLNLSNTTVAIGAPNTIDSFSLTMPAQ